MCRLLTPLSNYVVVLHPCILVNTDNCRNGWMTSTTLTITIAISPICTDCFLPTKFLRIVRQRCIARRKILSLSEVMYLPGGVSVSYTHLTLPTSDLV